MVKRAASQLDAKPPAVEPTTKPVAAGPNCAGRPQYTIASVSPRFVTLRGGGQSLIDLVPGSDIPCYGKIKEITQEGSHWIVKTNHDVIGAK